MVGSHEIQFSLVDTKTEQVLASWVERDFREGEDCYYYNEDEDILKHEKDQRNVDPYSAHIGKLELRTTTEDLKRHFCSIGEIRRVTPLRCKNTGQLSCSSKTWGLQGELSSWRGVV